MNEVNPNPKLKMFLIFYNSHSKNENGISTFTLCPFLKCWGTDLWNIFMNGFFMKIFLFRICWDYFKISQNSFGEIFLKQRISNPVKRFGESLKNWKDSEMFRKMQKKLFFVKIFFREIDFNKKLEN